MLWVFGIVIRGDRGEESMVNKCGSFSKELMGECAKM
jgi:hypothetical protein